VWQDARALTGGLFVGLIPLALGYASGATWMPDLLHVPLSAIAYGSLLAILFLASGCLLRREQRLFGIGMIAGIASTLATYAVLLFADARSYQSSRRLCAR
jgi:hypothetical protein